MATVKGIWHFLVDFPKTDTNFGNINIHLTYTTDRIVGSPFECIGFSVDSDGLVKIVKDSVTLLHLLKGGVLDFGEIPIEVPIDFYNWFTANATKPASNEPTEITYSGVTTFIEAGQTATLSCEGKKAVADIVVVFGADGTIAYNDAETAVEAGHTATMACAGKKMLTDVVISV